MSSPKTIFDHLVAGLITLTIGEVILAVGETILLEADIEDFMKHNFVDPKRGVHYE